MSDLEARLRAEVARRTGELSPSADLPDRIHKRVVRRRRQRKLQAVAASVVVLGLAIPMLLLVRPSSESETEVTGPDEFPDHPSTESSTSSTGEDAPPPSTQETTGTTGTTGTTDTPETTDGIPEEGPSPSPTDSAVPGPTEAPTSVPPPNLKPPDSDMPAAGVCAAASGPVVEMTINPDVPDPRCMQVSPGQRLQVRNNTDQEVTVSLAGFSATLAPRQSQQFDQPFGDYLQPGVHRVGSSPYPGGEIYLTS